jgi:hypothetical protein
MFKTNSLVILAVSAVAAFALLYWLFDWSVATALAITVAYTVIALVSMYLKGRSTS